MQEDGVPSQLTPRVEIRSKHMGTESASQSQDDTPPLTQVNHKYTPTACQPQPQTREQAKIPQQRRKNLSTEKRHT